MVPEITARPVVQTEIGDVRTIMLPQRLRRIGGNT